jgi:hypothetical protein
MCEVTPRQYGIHCPNLVGTKGLFWPRCIGLSQWARTLVVYLS